ncbi:peptidoglycan DD-metalloendopeptidase family protein [Candidatus Berkelbacteria bacterium]|nr:peptidoglycan DD-metalloendopeptidase family protein [Candidatus Berkelbacteria bacterium]
MDPDRTPRRSNHLRRALMTALLAAVLALPVALLLPEQLPVYAADDGTTLKELQQRAIELNRQIRESRQAAERKAKEAKSLTGQIDRIETDIDVTEARIESTEGTIEETEAGIQAIEADIERRQRELDEQRGHQDETLRVLYETGDDELLFLLAGASSISELIEHTEYLESLEEQIDAWILEVETLKRALEDRRSELKDKHDELTALQSQQEAFKVGLADQRAKKDALLTQTKQEQARYEDQLEEAKKLNTQVESQMASIRAKLTAGTGPGVVQAKDRGTSPVGLQWPTDYTYISTYFGGSTPFQPNGGHGGLDLVNSAGTPLYATGDGTITAVEEMRYNGQYYAYGKYVVIGHNARFSSLYAHLQSILVIPGDEVKRGDVIGYMGSTGWSTGPHLHYEIWEYSSRVNPLNYLP